MEKKRNKVHVIVLLIILTASFYIRYKGIWFGYPLTVHPDENVLIDAALNITKTGNLNPNVFIYPSLNIYFLAAVFKLFIPPDVDIPIIHYYLAGRLFMVMLSTLTIFVTYKIGSKLIHPLAGLASACYIGVSFLHITKSFTVTVDPATALWVSCAAYMAVLIYSNGRKLRYYLLCGIFIGFSIGSKYNAFLCVLPMLIAHAHNAYKHGKWFDKNIILGLLIIPITFIITTPYAVIDWSNFISWIKANISHYRSGHVGAEAIGTTSYREYFRYLIYRGYGILPLIFSCCGLIWLSKKNVWKASLLFSFPLALFLFIGQYKVYFERNIIAAIPFLSLFGGIFIYGLFSKFDLWFSKFKFKSYSITAAYIVTGVLLIYSISNWALFSYEHVRQITLPDTRWISLEWINSNIQSGSKIGREPYTPPVEQYTDKFTVTFFGHYGMVKEKNKIEELDIMVLSSGNYLRFTNHPDRYPEEARIYEEFRNRHKLLKEFVPDNIETTGPMIHIYKIIE